MGRYYATAQGEEPSVAEAIEEHYKPQGPNDRVPTAPVSIAVALADKLDTLVGFWAIDEKPTGSKDPYALRRAALGVIRIVLENGLRLRLTGFLSRAYNKHIYQTRNGFRLFVRGKSDGSYYLPEALKLGRATIDDAEDADGYTIDFTDWMFEPDEEIRRKDKGDDFSRRDFGLRFFSPRILSRFEIT